MPFMGVSSESGRPEREAASKIAQPSVDDFSDNEASVEFVENVNLLPNEQAREPQIHQYLDQTNFTDDEELMTEDSEEVLRGECLADDEDNTIYTSTTKFTYHYVPGPLPLTFKLWVSPGPPFTDEPMLHAHCLHNNRKVGEAEGQLNSQDPDQINARAHKSSFLMRGICASIVFDLPHPDDDYYFEQPKPNGTGVWGQEVDTGDYLRIDMLLVAKQWRSQNIGKRLVEHLINASREGSESGLKWTFLKPQDVQWNSRLEVPEDDKEQRMAMKRMNHERRLRFYRKLGFRRIGASQWFGLAEDPEHRSHKIPENADYDPPYVEEDSDDEDSSGVST